MEVIVIEKDAYYKLIEEVVEFVRDELKKSEKQDEWIESNEARKLLGFRSKTKLQQLRDNGEIIFSQHGRIIKYSRSSIMDFIERNIIS